MALVRIRSFLRLAADLRETRRSCAARPYRTSSFARAPMRASPPLARVTPPARRGFVRPPAGERSHACRTTKTPSIFTLTQCGNRPPIQRPGSGARCARVRSGSPFGGKSRCSASSLTSTRRARLIVEVDGGYHERRVTADARRDRKLTRVGYRVVRLQAELVMHDISAALRAVRRALNEP